MGEWLTLISSLLAAGGISGPIGQDAAFIRTARKHSIRINCIESINRWGTENSAFLKGIASYRHRSRAGMSRAWRGSVGYCVRLRNFKTRVFVAWRAAAEQGSSLGWEIFRDWGQRGCCGNVSYKRLDSKTRKLYWPPMTTKLSFSEVGSSSTARYCSRLIPGISTSRLSSNSRSWDLLIELSGLNYAARN